MVETDCRRDLSIVCVGYLARVFGLTAVFAPWVGEALFFSTAPPGRKTTPP